MPKFISQMRNLGPKTERMLREIGIANERDLRKTGAVEAYRRLKFVNAVVSLNALYAMEAALRDIDWRSLTREEKEKLRRAAGERLSPRSFPLSRE